MRKALDILGLLLRIAALVLLCLLSFAVWRAFPIVRSLQADADEAHRVLLEAGLTATEARKASLDERKYLKDEIPLIASDAEKILRDSDALVLRADRSADALDGVALSANRAIDKATGDLDDIRPVLDEARKSVAGLQPVEVAATQTITDVDALVKSPDIPQTFKNVNEGTAEIAATAKDVREEVHAITHPQPLDRIIGWVLKAGQVAGTWFGGVL